MREILFLAHRIPYPPNKGDKIRSYHLLRHLAERHVVHLGTFIDDEEDWRHADTLRALCGECHFAALHRRRSTLRSLAGLLDGRALTLPYYADRALKQWVRNIAATRPLGAAVAFSSAMAQYLEDLPVRRVADLVDVDSDKWLQYARRAKPPARWIYGREAVRLAQWERHVCESFDATFLVSAPYPAGEIPLVFTGAMDYWPNVDAVQWFARDMLPGIRERQPAAVFTIVGSRPAEAVRALASLPGVRVTGAVPDVRPWLAHARVAVAPMRVARGVQNKVLEAMAMARPVVVSPQGLEGIAAASPEEIRLAGDAAAFVDAVLALIAGRGEDVGSRARAHILARHRWSACLAPLEAALGFPGPAPSDRQAAEANAPLAHVGAG